MMNLFLLIAMSPSDMARMHLSDDLIQLVSAILSSWDKTWLTIMQMNCT